jgi:hypothetical protein
VVAFERDIGAHPEKGQWDREQGHVRACRTPRLSGLVVDTTRARRRRRPPIFNPTNNSTWLRENELGGEDSD